MGWDVETIRLSSVGISDRKMCNMVGESLHLGCITLVILLSFLIQKASWWDQQEHPDSQAFVEPTPGAGPPKKQRRRIGLLRQPSAQ
jgi:hypothetical protein